MLSFPLDVSVQAIRRVGVPLADSRLVGSELAAFVRELSFPCGHVAGTCRMGATGDPAAVVDSTCRVIGAGGLRVVDCSIMPTLPRANTNLPAMMIGERAAALINGEQRP